MSTVLSKLSPDGRCLHAVALCSRRQPLRWDGAQPGIPDWVGLLQPRDGLTAMPARNGERDGQRRITMHIVSARYILFDLPHPMRCLPVWIRVKRLVGLGA